MALWGVSGSDLKIFGINTAVGAGVVAGCAVAAWGVKKLACVAFAAVKPNATTSEQKKAAGYCQLGGLVAGLGAAAAAYKFVPASRFALVPDLSTSKMFKVGVVQAVAGFILDNFVSDQFLTGTVVGFGGAAATRFGNLVLPVLGAVGAGLGAGCIQR
jgi:hypothetical protein